MIKKILFCIYILLFLLNYSFADTDMSNDPINAPSNAPKVESKGFLNDYIVTPITDVALLATAPIGSFVGLFEGATKSQEILYNGEHHSGDSDIVNIFVAPFAAIGFALGGAIYMTFKLPADLISGKTSDY
ncbi:hypothetical protein IBE20_07355 [Francisella tularensis subsp. novicida]|uniref:Uncharacterized protein n=2 Tax=Francisella tularensis TaxID=263 RepID=A0A6I4RWV3_FRATU|nr:hypothetical protein [Francisella tularensis]ABK90610.1 protein of unknown function [Francisella tularensis subsp. novicida U112]AJI44598.1 hypothetical protein AS84_725 [Francisella tularensis subsp. novicida F6168]AJI61304.1 hypothetical protein AW25_226 [Francisella tularensis subsp. novicida U112]AJJ47928.1 hypothetical protein CH70_141 [Francisella tularensis subsp. novicida]APC99077.1 hypothetical protein KX03_1830 [Francisella tularensis subsp. novicida]